MKNTSNQLFSLSGIFSLMLMISACGGSGSDPQTTGGNSGGENTTTDPGGPVVAPDGGSNSGGENTTTDLSGPVVAPEGGNEGSSNSSTDNGPPNVTAGSPLTASVAEDQFNLYQVPSGSQVVLDVASGRATLFLYDSLELENENFLCASRLGHGESACSATVDDGEIYALVYGITPANYTISATFDCSVPAINRWVDRNMRDYYLYSSQVPSVNPESYNTTDALLADLRFESLDPYSSISNAQSQADFTEQGIVKSFGFIWLRGNDGESRIGLVYDNSPFGRAGVKRGDIIVAVNGESWENLTNERYQQLIGTNENPLSTTWTLIDNDTSERKNIVAQLEEFSINTVLHAQGITHPDYNGVIGYLAFKNFIATSEQELQAAFNGFKEQPITDLVLDLRYNGGGLIRVADQISSLIAGPLTDGELFVDYQYNANNTDKNFSRFFAAQSNALGLSRLVVITSAATASASELVINSLRPYINVTTVGSRTEGKGFISSANTFCGVSLNAMEAEGVNASGVGVAGGIPADCFASDDLTSDFGLNTSTNEIEGMLRSAADYLVLGTCDVGPLTKRASAEGLLGQDKIYISERIK